jgi:hypothetical protein
MGSPGAGGESGDWTKAVTVVAGLRTCAGAAAGKGRAGRAREGGSPRPSLLQRPLQKRWRRLCRVLITAGSSGDQPRRQERPDGLRAPGEGNQCQGDRSRGVVAGHGGLRRLRVIWGAAEPPADPIPGI